MEARHLSSASAFRLRLENDLGNATDDARTAEAEQISTNRAVQCVAWARGVRLVGAGRDFSFILLIMGSEHSRTQQTDFSSTFFSPYVFDGLFSTRLKDRMWPGALSPHEINT